MGQEKQAGIQIARACAALGIVYFHSWVALTRFPSGTDHPIIWLKTYGWVSIQVFFAISGYVIALVVDRGAFDPRSFAIKRIFRIYPIWFATLAAFAIGAGLWRGFLPDETLKFFLYSATLLPTHGFPFYNIGWTLQHEMAFYALTLIVVPWLGLRGLVAVLAISALSWKWFDLQGIPGEIASHHGEFLAGVLAYLFRTRLTRLGAAAPLASGALLLAYFVVNQHGLLFPFALFPLIVGFSNLRLKAGAWWTRAAATVGDASYSMYLIHPIVFMGVSSVTSKLQFLPYWTEEPIRFISIGTAIAISLVSWRYLERPAMKIGQRMIKPQYSLPLQDTSMTDAWSAALEVERERSTQ